LLLVEWLKNKGKQLKENLSVLLMYPKTLESHAYSFGMVLLMLAFG
jgi:hypothetical protein